MKVIGLNGSPNKNGNTKELLNILKEELNNKNIDMEILDIMDVLKDVKQPFCSNCSKPCNESCFKGTELEKAYEKVSDTDVFIVASPVYFGNVSAQLKIFFDKSRNIRNSKKWIGKMAVGMSVGHSSFGGQEITVNAINNMLMIHGFTILNDGSKEYGAGHFGICAKEPVDKNNEVVDRIKVLVSRMEESYKYITK